MGNVDLGVEPAPPSTSGNDSRTLWRPAEGLFPRSALRQRKHYPDPRSAPPSQEDRQVTRSLRACREQSRPPGALPVLFLVRRGVPGGRREAPTRRSRRQLPARLLSAGLAFHSWVEKGCRPRPDVGRWRSGPKSRDGRNWCARKSARRALGAAMWALRRRNRGACPTKAGRSRRIPTQFPGAPTSKQGTGEFLTLLLRESPGTYSAPYA
jgi:hypothetical protein